MCSGAASAGIHRRTAASATLTTLTPGAIPQILHVCRTACAEAAETQQRHPQGLGNPGRPDRPHRADDTAGSAKAAAHMAQ
jgi:hypothetical protein